MQANGGSLCRPVVDVVPSQVTETLPLFNKLANQAGYEAELQGSETVIRPRTLTPELQRAAAFKLPEFPALANETMASMGGMLQGWLTAGLYHPKGFAMESVSSSDSERVSLSASSALTAPQIAGKITNLGTKGVWVLYDRQAAVGTGAGIVLKIYSYKDDVRAMDQLSCLDVKPE